MRVPRSRSRLNNRSAARDLRFESLESRELLATIGNNLARGDTLAHYRLAISATGEYTQHFGGVAAAQQAVVDIIDDLNEIFETELSIRLDLVTGTETIFPDPNTDPFTYNDLGSMKSENQATLDSIVGNENYDVGHVFGKRPSGWAGSASISSVGVAGSKARGGTNSSTPVGDTWLKALAHEIGHQFRGLHTFNGVAGSCSSNQRASLGAYEPGSGTTIMSYGGSCSSDNVQSSPSKDPYYHAANFEDIQVYTGNLGSNNTSHALPYQTTATGNGVPTITAGSDYTIPARTPFALTASGSDPDGNPVTYTWEQLDLGPAIPLDAPDNGSSPLFRSFMPSADPTRVFPTLQSIVSGANSPGETLPTTSRALNFRATIRDGIGGVNSDDMRIDTIDTGVPFAITSPALGTVWSGGSTQTITWNVAGTDSGSINTQQVRVLLSTDGGATFPFTLATTDNDGTHALQVPNLDTSTARLKIEPVGNVYFAINPGDFTISQSAGVASVNIAETGGETRAYEAATDDTYSLSLSNDPGGVVEVTVTADAQSVVSLDGLNFAASQTVSLDSTGPSTVIVRAVDDTDEDGRHQSTLSHAITFSTSPLYSTATLIDNLTVHIVDDELPPVAGADYEWFNEDFSPSRSPENWAQNPWYNDSNQNLTRDDGVATSFDLSYVRSGSSWAHTAPIFSQSVPRHDPPLQQISGYSRRANYIIATYSDLTPGASYGVYVFGLTHSNQWLSQDITITGATTLPTFNQTMSDRFLQVNGEQGSSARTLKSYEMVVEADSQGRIVIDARTANGSIGVALAGLAIREIPPEPPTPEVVARHLFYNDSAFDDGPAANATDDNAIASDKQPLLPGEVGSFTNYSNDPRGITGVMVDMVGAPNSSLITIDDFTFHVGRNDPNTWGRYSLTLPTLSVRPGAGVDGSDRVTLIWPAGEIVNQWLRVTVEANPATGLAEGDVFYFGNAVGETGGFAGDSRVNGADFFRVRHSPRSLLNPAEVDDSLDINRDSRVDARDLIVVRDNVTTLGDSLPLWVAPGGANKRVALPPKPLATETDPGVGGSGPIVDHDHDHDHEEVVHPVFPDPPPLRTEVAILADDPRRWHRARRLRALDTIFAASAPATVDRLIDDLARMRLRLESRLETIASWREPADDDSARDIWRIASNDARIELLDFQNSEPSALAAGPSAGRLPSNARR